MRHLRIAQRDRGEAFIAESRSRKWEKRCHGKLYAWIPFLRRYADRKLRMIERARDASSPFYQAQLLPNLYFPREPSSRGERALWDQVDLVVATRQAAFVDNVNVSVTECGSYCMAHASGYDARSFVDAIEAECEKLPLIMDQQQLDRLGETLVTTYGDLNQKRGRLHVQRIKNMR